MRIETGTLDLLADAWAERNSLQRDASYWGLESIYPLFPSGEKDWRTVEREHFGSALFRHSRAFRVRGAPRPSVFVSAPYEENLLRVIGDRTMIVHHAWAIAEALSLRVRIGVPDDRIYVSPSSPELVTVPIVWWKRSLALDYPALGTTVPDTAVR